MFYQTQMPSIFLILFSDIGQCLRPAQTKSLENQKSGHVSKYVYFTSLHLCLKTQFVKVW